MPTYRLRVERPPKKRNISTTWVTARSRSQARNRVRKRVPKGTSIRVVGVGRIRR